MTQTLSHSAVKEREETILREPRLYKVELINDDVTTMDFVVRMLKQIFYKSDADADTIMMATHKEGKAVVGSYTYDMARSKVGKATQMARKEGFPLKLTYMPE